MAATFVPNTPRGEVIPVAGATVILTGVVTLDNSYVTGGEPLTASIFGLDTLKAVITNGYTGVLQKAIQVTSDLKLKVVVDAAGTWAEAANASDQSAVTVPVIVIGEKFA